MSESYSEQAFRTTMLRAELSALLHDIGKCTRAFVLSKVKGKEKDAYKKYKHWSDFLEGDVWPNQCCDRKLFAELNRNLPDDWLNIPGVPALKKLGDIMRLHHSRDEVIMKYYGMNKGDAFALPFPLTVMADTLDSATSKGGGKPNWKKGRNSCIPEGEFDQDADSCYIATPLGEEQRLFKDYNAFQNEAMEFQRALAHLLKGHEGWEMEELKERRRAILALMRERLSSVLAETRLPNNDVSLWQHSYSTVSIFKAMLAGHLLAGDPVAYENRTLTFYKEKLAILGVRWSEDELLSRSIRPRDILGRRLRLLKLREKLVAIVEEEFALGNRIYQDRDGVCFLIPSHQEAYMKTVADGLCERLESVLNEPKCSPGNLLYEIRCKGVGIQILGLADLLAGDGDILRIGPREPRWVEKWKDKGSNLEICSRCGIEPVGLIGTSVGSELEEEKICMICKEMVEEADALRYKESPEVQSQILGVPRGIAEFFTFMTDELVEKDDENSRLALIQGVFDLRPFLSGEAFSSLFAGRPSDCCLHTGDKSLSMHTWEKMHDATERCWDQVLKGQNADEVIDTFQQLFQDTFLGTEGDGRIAEGTGFDKLKNYVQKIVLPSPFPPSFTDIQKIMVYALRVHPAPSRIARVWETTERLCREPILWCEQKKIKYFPLSLDTGRFLILVSARNAWALLHAVLAAYHRAAGRVRHLLPFHLSASVFYYKFPLYVGIDAMRRFSDLQLGRGEARTWELRDKSMDGDTYRLIWLDHQEREVTWIMPARMPNRREERFYTWFWPEGSTYPVSVQEIAAGTKVSIWPSTFDYEVLDSTARRYDIRDSGGGSRPHIYCGEIGPRPYPLEDLEVWEANLEIQEFKAMEQHQVNRLIGFLGILHGEWKGCTPDVFERQAGDYLRLCLEGKKDWPTLQRMARTGALFDVFEWKNFIEK